MAPQAPPSDPITQYQHALALHQAGRLDEATVLYRAMLAQFPGNPLLMASLGTIALQQGNAPEGVQQLEASLAIEPDQPQTLSNLGIALWHVNRAADALACFDRAVALHPDFADAYNYRGVVLHAMKRMDEALASFDRTIFLNPENAEAHSHRGVVLHDMGRLDEALASLDRAIALKSDYAEAYNNRGNIFKGLHGMPEARAACDPADSPDSANGEARTRQRNSRHNGSPLQEAHADFARALALKPDYAPAHWNMAMLKLLLGEYEEGWKHYEWRWLDWEKEFARNLPQPLWLGDTPIAGKTLLVYPEQGYGDFIQFCRYLPMLDALGAKVVVEVPPALLPLVSTLQGSFTLVPSGQPLPAFDLQCPIMSLPLAFRTTVDTIPANVPYLFADPARLQVWRLRLGPKARMRVGITWSGNPTHKNDLNRSIPARLLAPLLALPVDFHALQKDVRPEDAAALAQYANVQVHSADLGDFADTAALAQEMDLVISVDTSVAHVAGALGRPVWLLLPFNPDYRWLLGRSDSPWYPTATLFRQPVIGDWASAISQVAARLQARPASRP